MENRIKECQLDLFADRTSAATMRANQLRLWFASMPMVPHPARGSHGTGVMVKCPVPAQLSQPLNPLFSSSVFVCNPSRHFPASYKRASPLSPLTYLYRPRPAEARRNIYFGLKGKNWSVLPK
jgi:hypothetical protein